MEISSQPGEPANVSRDDLVYPVGTMHLVNTTVGFVSPSLNPRSCLFRMTLLEDSEIVGGTGLFAHASGTFTGAISPQGLLPRNPDGSCATVGDTLVPRGGHGRVQRDTVALPRPNDEHRSAD